MIANPDPQDEIILRRKAKERQEKDKELREAIQREADKDYWVLAEGQGI